MKRQDALDYHAHGRPGKIAVVPSKPLLNQRDLALAYSPGVAEPCLEIAKNPEDAYRYTAKGNLVAVVTNGTAVLGLGNIGAVERIERGGGELFQSVNAQNGLPFVAARYSCRAWSSSSRISPRSSTSRAAA